MKRIGIGIVALGLSLSALTLGSKAASAAEPCGPQVVVQPSGYGYSGYGRARELRRDERVRLERQRELGRRRYDHRW
jgi:hypothetical protein